MNEMGKKIQVYSLLFFLIILALILYALILDFSAGRSAGTSSDLDIKRSGVELPADDSPHPGSGSEWWFFVGHLRDENGNEYGYQLVFRIRQGIYEPFKGIRFYKYCEADFTVTDEKNRRFFAETSRLPPFSFYGINRNGLKIKAGKALIEALDEGKYSIVYKGKDYSVAFILIPEKSPMIQGDNGWVTGNAGCGLFYTSQTRLGTSGTLSVNKEKLSVNGFSWMDHQWGDCDMSDTRWNWLCVQLDNGDDLMVYELFPGAKMADLFRSDGSRERTSDLLLVPRTSWKSPATGISYPSGWHLEIPPLEISLDIEPVLPDQEVAVTHSLRDSYWEGKCRVSGTIGGEPSNGRAYVELVGYCR